MVKRFIDNDFLWHKVSENPELLIKAMRSRVESLVRQHPHLRHDVFITDSNEGIVSIVVVDTRPMAYVVTETNFDLVCKVLESNPSRVVRTALVQLIPTTEHFLAAGGKRGKTRDIPLIGETSYIWTIGGKFRGKVSEEDPRRLVWYNYPEEE